MSEQIVPLKCLILDIPDTCNKDYSIIVNEIMLPYTYAKDANSWIQHFYQADDKTDAEENMRDRRRGIIAPNIEAIIFSKRKTEEYMNKLNKLGTIKIIKNLAAYIANELGATLINYETNGPFPIPPWRINENGSLKDWGMIEAERLARLRTTADITLHKYYLFGEESEQTEQRRTARPHNFHQDFPGHNIPTMMIYTNTGWQRFSPVMITFVLYLMESPTIVSPGQASTVVKKMKLQVGENVIIVGLHPPYRSQLNGRPGLIVDNAGEGNFWVKIKDLDEPILLKRSNLSPYDLNYDVNTNVYSCHLGHCALSIFLGEYPHTVSPNYGIRRATVAYKVILLRNTRVQWAGIINCINKWIISFNNNKNYHTLSRKEPILSKEEPTLDDLKAFAKKYNIEGIKFSGPNRTKERIANDLLTKYRESRKRDKVYSMDPVELNYKNILDREYSYADSMLASNNPYSLENPSKEIEQRDETEGYAERAPDDSIWPPIPPGWRETIDGKLHSILRITNNTANNRLQAWKLSGLPIPIPPDIRASYTI